MNKWMHLSSVAVLAIGLLGGFANTASPIEVSPPSPVPALSPTVITVTYAAENSFVMVLGVVDGKMYLPEVKDAGPGVLTFSGPPGQYAVMGMEDGKRFQTTIIVEGSGPDPDPDPDPEPDPFPPGKRFVIIIRESTDDSARLKSAVREVQDYAAKQGHEFLFVDDDSEDSQTEQRPKWLTGYLETARKDGHELPLMVVLAKFGDKQRTTIRPLPTVRGEAVDLLKEFGG